MSKSVEVEFRLDASCEMLAVYINGKCWREGNYLDFDFVRDVPSLLDKLGIENYEEEYSYEDEEEE